MQLEEQVAQSLILLSKKVDAGQGVHLLFLSGLPTLQAVQVFLKLPQAVQLGPQSIHLLVL